MFVIQNGGGATGLSQSGAATVSEAETQMYDILAQALQGGEAQNES